MTDAKENVERIVAEADALYHDLDFGAVKRFKEAHPEAKVIGCLPTYSPKEIIHAAGMLPVHLRGAGDQVEIIRGDAYFQSYICQHPAQHHRAGAQRAPRALDGLPLPEHLRRDPQPVGHVAAALPRKVRALRRSPPELRRRRGRALLRARARASCDDLERRGARGPTDDRLRRPSPPTTQPRRASKRSSAARRAPRARPVRRPRPTWSCARADSSSSSDHTRRWCASTFAAVLELDAPQGYDQQCGWSCRGAFCEQPPLGLIKTLERAGCYIVDDDFHLGSRFIVDVTVADRGRPAERPSRAPSSSSATASRYIVRAKQKGPSCVSTVRRLEAPRA
jgi:benzoyl-CoA reductase subunit C